MKLNQRIEVPTSIFLSRWWEVAARVVFFMLGASYTAIFGQLLPNDTYIGAPLLVIAVGILFGRYAAERRVEEVENKKIMVDILEMEMEHQRSIALLNAVNSDWLTRIHKLAPPEQKTLLQLMSKMSTNQPTPSP